MKTQEFGSRSGFALSVVLTPATQNEISDEFERAKTAIVDWRARKGANCELVMFTVVVPEALMPAIEKQLESLVTNDAQLSPLLQQIKVEANLMNPEGKDIKSINLTSGSTSVNGKKPWWKFW